MAEVRVRVGRAAAVEPAPGEPPLEDPRRSVPPSRRHGRRREREQPQAAVRRRSVLTLLLTAGVLAVASWVFVDAGRLLMADLGSMRARWLVGQWAAGTTKPPTPAEWTQARRALEGALAWTPDDPALHDRLGDLHAVAGARDWDDEASSTESYRRALDHYRAALALRPLDPQTWASLAGALAGAGERETPAFGEAWAQALRLGPHEGHVQPMLMSLALSNWDVATPAMRDWVVRFHAEAAEPQRAALHKVAARYGLRFDEAGTPQPVEAPLEPGGAAEISGKGTAPAVVTDRTDGDRRP